jgi:hypothetical protein
VSIPQWTGFFGAETGAFAALTGLVFVALSINLKTILELPGASGRAGEALVVLVEPVLLGLAGLVRHQGRPALGAEWLAIGLLGGTATAVLLLRGRLAMAERTFFEVAARVTPVLGANLLVLLAGVLLLGGSLNGLYLQAAGVALCLLAGITAAWVLLVEILR